MTEKVITKIPSDKREIVSTVCIRKGRLVQLYFVSAYRAVYQMTASPVLITSDYYQTQMQLDFPPPLPPYIKVWIRH